MKTSESVEHIFPALATAQSKIKGAKTDANNPFFNSKYADMASVVESLREPFALSGLGFIQGVSDDAKMLVTRIFHTSGEWIETSYPLSCKDWANPQAVGSSVTYAKRYGLQAAAGIPSVDDDGNTAAQSAQRPQPASRPVTQGTMPANKPASTSVPTRPIGAPAKPTEQLKARLENKAPIPNKAPSFQEIRKDADRNHTIETKGFDPDEEMPF